MKSIRTLRVTVFLLVASFFHVSGIALPITIQEDSPSRFVCTFSNEEYQVTTFTEDKQEFSRINFITSDGMAVDENRIALPYKALIMGIPQQGTPTLTVTPLQVRQISLNAPLAITQTKERVRIVPFAGTFASGIYYSRYRSVRTATLYLRPITYDPSRRVVQVLEKALIQVTFPAVQNLRQTGRSIQNEYDRMLQSLVLNPGTTYRFLMEPEGLPIRPAFNLEMARVRGTPTKVLRFTIGDGNSGLNDGFTKENGVIKITPVDITSIASSSQQIASIRLYASIRQMIDSIVPKPESISLGRVEIPLLRVDNNGNGIFDQNDYLLAYTTGINDWKYDTQKNQYAFSFNHYESNRTYWLEIGGSAGATIKDYSCSQQSTEVFSSFVDFVRYQHSTDIQDDGSWDVHGSRLWMWKRLTRSDRSFSCPVDTSGISVSLAGAVKIDWGMVNVSVHEIAVKWGDSTISDTLSESWLKLNSWSKPTLAINYSGTVDRGMAEVVDFSISSQKSLSMKNINSLRIFSIVDAKGKRPIVYRISDISVDSLNIFRITPSELVVQKIPALVQGGVCSWVDTANSGMQYFVCTNAAVKSLGTVLPEIDTVNDNTEYEVRSVRSEVTGSDYCIITHPQFRNQALKLARFKKEMGRFSAPKVVLTTDIYREFSGGNRDPGAIRNALAFARNTAQWQKKPDYVLLLGNGHYDYKGYKSQEVNFVPPAEVLTSVKEFDCTDDYYAILRPGVAANQDSVAPEIFMGRITCTSNQEAEASVNKIMEYENPTIANFGAWRNRVLLVSDDDQQGPEKDNIVDHHIGNEEIEQILNVIAPGLEIRKTLLFEYPWNDAWEKPEASSAIFSGMNETGVSIVNFFCHGNWECLTDERVLNIQKIGNLNNSKRYPLLNAFSCSVGWFDKPGQRCLTGQLVCMANAGAIGSIAASRTAYSNLNQMMSRTFFSILYGSNNRMSFSHAFTLTKARDANNLKYYVFLGDPSIAIVPLTDSCALKITDERGKAIDTLNALQKVVLSGSIFRNGLLNTGFGSVGRFDSITIGLYNPPTDSNTRKDGGTFSNPKYRLPGKPIYTGTIPVTNGTFLQPVLLPRRVVFNKPKVEFQGYAFSRDGKQFSVGFKNTYLFNGTMIDTSSAKDTVGPQIYLRVLYQNDSLSKANAGFTDKLSGTLPFKFAIDLYDPNGIDLSGTGPDEGFNYEVPGVLQSARISNKFNFAAGSFTQGSAIIELTNKEIKPGSYSLVVKAQDLMGNASKRSIGLDIVSPEEFMITRIFSFPNPVRMGSAVRFYFYHSDLSANTPASSPVYATIRIFTLSGRLIRIFRNAPNGQAWDLRDQQGVLVSPNVYLYRVTVEKNESPFLMNSPTQIKSEVKKIVVLPPR